jgi:mycothiol system anti-sigma-R factor
LGIVAKTSGRPLLGPAPERLADDVVQVRHHLDECGPCLRQYGLEQVVKALVARSCGCDPAPADLRAKVLMRIRNVRIEVTTTE